MDLLKRLEAAGYLVAITPAGVLTIDFVDGDERDQFERQELAGGYLRRRIPPTAPDDWPMRCVRPGLARLPEGGRIGGIQTAVAV